MFLTSFALLCQEDEDAEEGILMEKEEEENEGMSREKDGKEVN